MLPRKSPPSTLGRLVCSTAERLTRGARARHALRVVSLLMPVAWAMGCGAARQAAPEAAPPAARTPPVSPSAEGGRWGKLQLKAFAASVELPEASSWRLENTRGWSRLRQAHTGSLFEFSIARAERVIRPRDCESRTRLVRPDWPGAAGEEVVDRQRVASPLGFTTEFVVSVGVLPRSAGDRSAIAVGNSGAAPAATDAGVEGHVVAFGASVGKCLSFHYTTQAYGRDAAAEVAERLRLVVSRVLPSIELRAPDQRVSPVELP